MVSPVVLVEGLSDKVAVETLAVRLGCAVTVVAIGGATNVRRFAGPGVIGMCDRREEHYFAAALERWVVCDPDLEGEFIRALGVDGIEEVIEQQGELDSFRVLQQQPFQRDRTPEQQLDRFFGGRSGNKIRYAALLARAVPLERIPPPLVELFDAVQRA